MIGQVLEVFFLLTAYRAVVERYQGKHPSEWVIPGNPVQFRQINMYQSGIMGLHTFLGQLF
jgi:hypothetical protein